MADIPEGSFTHTLEQIDAAVTDVTNAIGQAESLSAAITAAAESAATTAVGNLDASEVGGTGKYISAIKEENGIIVPTVANIASAPASGGTAAISSGAVYTAVSDKITTAQAVSAVYGLGTNIAVGDDLNTYTNVGSFYTSTTERCDGAIHRPDFADANKKVFRLEVKTMNSSSRFIQELTTFIATTTGTEAQGYVERFVRAYTSGGWGAWYQLNTTAVNTYAPVSLNSVNPAQLQSTPPDDGEMR